jgi:hypothetical protein
LAPPHHILDALCLELKSLGYDAGVLKHQCALIVDRAEDYVYLTYSDNHIIVQVWGTSFDYCACLDLADPSAIDHLIRVIGPATPAEKDERWLQHRRKTWGF